MALPNKQTISQYLDNLSELFRVLADLKQRAHLETKAEPLLDLAPVHYQLVKI